MSASAAIQEGVAPGAWADAACASLVAVATNALQLPITTDGEVAAPTAAAISAYIPVMAPNEPLQIGIAADQTSCSQLARALLQLGPDDELGADDAADAFGEIANMVAGMTKSAMSPWIGLVNLGLPMVIHGWVAPSDSIELDCRRATIGASTLTLVIARPRRRR